MERRITIQWTDTAKKQLAELDKKVRKGLLDKASGLTECSDPKSAYRALVGPLQGYYRITYGRFRAVYCVHEEQLASGDILVHIKINFIAVGKRKEHDRQDIYRIAEKMVSFGLVDSIGEESETDPQSP